jgi:hypothetical protein
VWTWDQEPPPDTVIHYGWDLGVHPHLKCTFNKFIYGDKLPWTDMDKYLSEIPEHKYEWTKQMIQDIDDISKVSIDRTNNRTVSTPVI